MALLNNEMILNEFSKLTSLNSFSDSAMSA